MKLEPGIWVSGRGRYDLWTVFGENPLAACGVLVEPAPKLHFKPKTASNTGQVEDVSHSTGTIVLEWPH